ncbi:hypothetical protein ACMGD3_24245 [Lysinibacillus sphaericus]|uniref:hypothetical protein n=1 Tax=Lysinibacillus sphaericus TaxID=1421 RepID=UPI003F7AB92B
MKLHYTKKLVPSAVLVAMLLTSFGTSVGAEEKKQTESVTPITVVESVKNTEEQQNETTPKTLAELLQKEETNGLTSSNDERRTKALEKEYNIQLEESDHWSVKYPDYTPINTLKQMGYYHVNANRQALIFYAIRTNDWQPYRAFEAKNTPLYFEIVDGKFEYSKIYFGNAIEKYIFNNQLMGIDLEKTTPENAIHVAQLKSYIEKFKAAPGIVPSVIGLNHRDELALQYGVKKANSDYFNSDYNNPKVMQVGRFK